MKLSQKRNQGINLLNKNIKISAAIFIVWFIFSGNIFGRDVNLDEIYLKKSSKYLSRLIQFKLDAYQSIDAVFIDKNVIFAGWISGDEILYIQEIPELDANILYLYNIHSRKSSMLCRIPGIISVAKFSSNGKFVVIKRINQKEGDAPTGETLVYIIQSGKLKSLKSAFPFLDFDIPIEGDSVIYETGIGFEEYFPGSEIKKIILKKERYADIVVSNNPSLSFLSPDRQSILVINGGGGNYTAKTIKGGSTESLKGITSSNEVFWLDKQNIVFRSGYPGNFSVIKYNTATKTAIPLLSLSMNTNLCYSSHARILTFLKDQMLHVYKLSDGIIINTGIEGEDVSFSAGGTRFTSIIYKKLFVANFNILRKKQVDLKRSWETILANYSDLKNRNLEWENDYSLDYINRKIFMYSSLLKK